MGCAVAAEFSSFVEANDKRLFSDDAGIEKFEFPMDGVMLKTLLALISLLVLLRAAANILVGFALLSLSTRSTTGMLDAVVSVAGLLAAPNLNKDAADLEVDKSVKVDFGSSEPLPVLEGGLKNELTPESLGLLTGVTLKAVDDILFSLVWVTAEPNMFDDCPLVSSLSTRSTTGISGFVISIVGTFEAPNLNPGTVLGVDVSVENAGLDSSELFAVVVVRFAAVAKNELAPVLLESPNEHVEVVVAVDIGIEKEPNLNVIGEFCDGELNLKLSEPTKEDIYNLKRRK